MNDCSRWNLIAAGPSRAHLRPEHLLPGAPTCVVNRAIDVVQQGIKVDFCAVGDAPSGFWTPDGAERFLRIQPHIQLWVTSKFTTRAVKIKTSKQLKKGVPSPAFLRPALNLLPEAFRRPLVDFAEKALMTKEEEITANVPGPPISHLWEMILPASTGMRELPYGTIPDVNDKKQGRYAFTTIMALQRIWHFNPDHVRILCADMAGPWIEGKTEEECHQYEKERVEVKGGQVPLDRWRHERHALEESIKAYKAKAGKEVLVEWIRPEPALATA